MNVSTTVYKASDGSDISVTSYQRGDCTIFHKGSVVFPTPGQIAEIKNYTTTAEWAEAVWRTNT